MNQRGMRGKLIFNPGAGATRGSHIEILDVIRVSYGRVSNGRVLTSLPRTRF